MRQYRNTVKILVFILSLALFLAAFVFTARAEETTAPHIVYTRFTMDGLYGLVDLPDDGNTYYMRFTFFLPGDTYFVMLSPVPDAGYFYIWISCHSEHITMELIGRPMLASDPCITYDMLAICDE